MMDKLKELFDLKTFVTVCITITLCYMTVTGKMEIKDFTSIAMMIYAFYFTKPSKKVS